MHLRRLLTVFTTLAVSALPLFASHGWGGYHWGRVGTSPAPITIYDSTTTTNTAWGTHLNRSVFGDTANPNTTNRRGWNNSAVLNLSITTSGTDSGTRSSCPAVSNAVRVCNYTYGTGTGWLGLASINVVSGSTVHIAWGTAKMNDSFFNSTSYPNTEKRHVMCQEVGHTFGLGHTSENGSSQNTCMDYYSNTSASDWKSTGPNQHDFDQLAVQAHYTGVTTKAVEPVYASEAITAGIEDQLARAFPFELNEEWQWGTPVEFDASGRAHTYKLDLGKDADGNDQAIYTFVTWADDVDAGHGHAARIQE